MNHTTMLQRFARLKAGRACVLALAMATTVHADTIGTPLVQTLGAATRMCVITNVGTTSVDVASVQLLDPVGLDVKNGTSCGGELLPGASCHFYSLWPTAGEWQRAVVDLAGRNTAKQIRGQCQISDANNQIMISTEIR